MEDDLKQLLTMVQEYVDGKHPLPHAFVFTVITPCRHGNGDHYDYEHCIASQDNEEGSKAFDMLTDYTLGACEEYHGT
jgi:hypothetical protein